MTDHCVPRPPADHHSRDVATVLNHAAHDLAQRFGACFSTETIREVLHESYDMLAITARVHTFLPLLATRSAGSAPAETINPAVHATMAEVGIDLSQEFPKPLTDEAVQAADVVITVGCGDACPVYPGKRYLNWELADPAGRNVDEVRPIRDDIDRRVRALLDELAPVP